MRNLVKLACALAIASPAAAQDFFAPAPAIDPGVAGMNAAIYSVQKSEERRAGRRAAPARPLAFARAFQGPPPASARAASLGYTPSAALKREALDAFLGRVRDYNADYAEDAAREFGRHDYSRIYQGIVAPFGLKANDAADSLTAYIVLGWMIANGAGDPSRQSVQAARSQIAGLLAADPRFNSPTGRAQLGEEFKILFVTLHSGWQSSRRERNVEDYADGVAQLFRQQGGIDLRGLALRNGFEPEG